MKMSKSEAGKLGGERSKAFSAARKKKNVEKYLLSPNSCKKCNFEIPYEGRAKIFCNASCAAAYNNVIRGNKTKVPCKHCGTLLRGPKGDYCSRKCQVDTKYNFKIDKWLSGSSMEGRTNYKRYLRETNGNKCSVCGLTDWNNKPIVLELEHVDGNSTNNRPENLCLICPNCHSQTPTFKGRNRGNGRHSRRERYAEGKSY